MRPQLYGVLWNFLCQIVNAAIPVVPLEGAIGPSIVHLLPVSPAQVQLLQAFLTNTISHEPSERRKRRDRVCYVFVFVIFKWSSIEGAEEEGWRPPRPQSVGMHNFRPEGEDDSTPSCCRWYWRTNIPPISPRSVNHGEPDWGPRSRRDFAYLSHSIWLNLIGICVPVSPYIVRCTTCRWRWDELLQSIRIPLHTNRREHQRVCILSRHTVTLCMRLWGAYYTESCTYIQGICSFISMARFPEDGTGSKTLSQPSTI